MASSSLRHPAWPIVAWGALFVLTVWATVRGGVLGPDLRFVSPADTAAAYQLLFARYVGVIDITLHSAMVLVPMLLAGLGIGTVLRRWVSPTMALLPCFTAGLGVLWLLMYAVSLAGGANGLVAWGLCIAGMAAGLIAHRHDLQRWSKTDQQLSLAQLPRLPWTALLTAIPAGLLVTAACAPPGTLWSVEAWGYDVLSYHLQIPREWLSAGRMVELEHNVYSYLPSLTEVAWLQLGSMRGSVYDAVYACQLLSVALAILTAGNLAQLARRWTPAPYTTFVGWGAAALFLATPWVLVTGSMAYNEMATLAMAAAAMNAMLWPCDTPRNADSSASRSAVPDGSDRHSRAGGNPVIFSDDHGPPLDSRLRGNDDKRPASSSPTSPNHPFRLAILIGLLAGLATLAKLTAGFMIAIPLGLLWLMMTPMKDRCLKRIILSASIVALTGFLTLTPYLARNAVWTGNPVFPFAANTLGSGHWDQNLVGRWNRGHHVEESFSERLVALGQQWVCNTGYGALGGYDRHRQPGSVESRNIAYFPRQWGVPTLLLLAALGGGVMLARSTHRRLALALLVMLGVQIIAWLFATHLQSRFMIFSMLPVVVMAAVGLGLLAQKLARLPIVPWAIITVMVGVLVLTSAGLLRNQTISSVPLWQVIDSLPAVATAVDPRQPMAYTGDHPINKLPAQSKTLILADNSRLFYLHRPFVYSSAFDANLLGQLLRDHPGDPQAVTAALRKQGFTHVWVHGPELARLAGSYGFDESVSFEALDRLIQTGWRPVTPVDQGIGLYQLP